MVKLFGLIFIILGTFIGAGCISGRETVIYFTNYSQYFLMSLIAVICITFIFNFYLNFGKKYRIQNFTDYNKILFGNKSYVFNFLFVVCILCIVGNMFAGLDLLLFPIIKNTLFINILLLVSIYIIVSHDISGIEKLNIVIIPFIIIFIVLITIFSIDITVMYNTVQECNISFFKVIIFIFLNVLDISVLLCQVANRYSHRTYKIASIICGVIIFIILILQSMSVLSNNIIDLELPMLELSKQCNLEIVYYFVSLFAMFTTLISAVYLVYSYLVQYCNKILSIIIISSVSILISALGFSFIISYVYILLGILGVVLFLRSIYVYYFK